jgi:hypothetical protein
MHDTNASDGSLYCGPGLLFSVLSLPADIGCQAQ